MMWLNRDIANILKDKADPITYGRLLRVAKVFSSSETPARRFSKMSQQRESLLAENPDPPRPLSPYLAFCRNERQAQAKTIAKIRAVDAAKGFGAKWRGMTESERKAYSNRYKTEKIAFDRVASAKRLAYSEGLDAFYDKKTIWKNKLYVIETAMLSISWYVKVFQDRRTPLSNAS